MTLALRYEAWEVPGSGVTFAVKIRDLQPIRGTGNKPKIPMGRGSLSMPHDYPRLAELTDIDNADHSNDVGSLIRVYRPGVDTEDQPIHEWLVESPLDLLAEGPVLVNGRNVEALLDREVVYPFDWDGTAAPDDFESTQPDHVYGGKNLLRNPSLDDGATIQDVYFWEFDATGGNYTIEVGPTGSRTSTAVIAFNAGVFAVETAIEAALNTAYGITDANVFAEQGDVTASQRTWTVTMTNPGFNDPPWTAAFAGLTGETYANFLQNTIGGLNPDPWTKSKAIRTTRQPENGTYLDFGLDDTNVLSGTYALRTDGLEKFAGFQQVVEGLRPGGLYFARIPMWTASSTNRWATILRDFFGNLIARSAFVATSNPSNYVTSDYDVTFNMPENSDGTLIFRFAYHGETSPPGQDANPSPLWTDDMELSEGNPPSSVGQILIDLFDDAQTDHAPNRAALTFVELDFTAAVDSSGAAWDDTERRITIKVGSTYLDMMRQFEKLGYQWRLVPKPAMNGTWLLQVYSPGVVMGTDHTGADTPTILVGQGNAAGSVTTHPPRGNVVLARGDGPLFSLRENAASLSSGVGRIARYIDDRRFDDTTAVGDFADESLATLIDDALTAAPVIQEPDVDGAGLPAWPRPLVEYFPGDVMDVSIVGRPVKVDRTVTNVSYLDDAAGLRWPLVLGDARPAVTSGGSGGSFSGTGVNAVTGTAAAGSDALGEGLVQDGTQAQQMNVLGYWVNEILERFNFRDDGREAGGVTLNSGGGGVPTVLVAAEDSPDWIKAMATFICDGVEDQREFYEAYQLVSSIGFGGGRIVLAGQRFQCNDVTVDPNAIVAEVLALTGDIHWQGMSWSSSGTIIEVETASAHAGADSAAVSFGAFGRTTVTDLTISVFTDGTATAGFPYALLYNGFVVSDRIRLEWFPGASTGFVDRGVAMRSSSNQVSKLTIADGDGGCALFFYDGGDLHQVRDLIIEGVETDEPLIYFDPTDSHFDILVDGVTVNGHTPVSGTSIQSIIYADSDCRGTVISNVVGEVLNDVNMVAGLFLDDSSSGITYHGISLRPSAGGPHQIPLVRDLGLNFPSDNRWNSGLTAAATLQPNPGSYLCDASGGAFTVTLPDAPEAEGVEVQLHNVSSTNVTVSRQGSTDQIQPPSGALVNTVTLNQYETIVVVSDGTNWLVVLHQGTIP